MGSCSKKACCLASSLPPWITITDRKRILLWGRTRPSRERFSHRQWNPSWLRPRSVDYTTATNDGLPKPEIPALLNIGVGNLQRRMWGCKKLTRGTAPDKAKRSWDLQKRMIPFSTTALLHFFLLDRVFGRDGRRFGSTASSRLIGRVVVDDSQSVLATVNWLALVGVELRLNIDIWERFAGPELSIATFADAHSRRGLLLRSAVCDSAGLQSTASAGRQEPCGNRMAPLTQNPQSSWDLLASKSWARPQVRII
jgi:hypothetical protein